MPVTIKYTGIPICFLDYGQSFILPKMIKPQSNIEVSVDVTKNAKGIITYNNKTVEIPSGSKAMLLCENKLLKSDVVISTSGEISGVWEFNKELTLTSSGKSISSGADFRSNGISFTQMFFDGGDLTYSKANSSVIYAPYYSGKWSNEAYRTIDYGTTVTSPNSDFYEWYIANANSKSVVEPPTSIRVILDDWQQIRQAIATGEYSTRYSIGDVKAMTLTDGTTVGMQIVAFDLDEKADGTGKAAITWIANTLIAKRRMNATATNYNGWIVTEMRAWLRDELLPTFPDEVINGIVEVKKTYHDRTTLSTLNCNDTIWLPSQFEVYGANSNYGCETAGVVYSDFFSDNKSRIKRYDGIATEWWLRTGAGSNGTGFGNVETNGGQINSAAVASWTGFGVAFGFCM